MCVALAESLGRRKTINSIGGVDKNSKTIKIYQNIARGIINFVQLNCLFRLSSGVFVFYYSNSFLV